MQNNYLWLFIGLCLAVLVGIGIFFFGLHTAIAPTTNTETTTEAASTTDLGGGLSVTGPAGAKIEVVDNSVPHPSLTQKIKVSDSLSPEAAVAVHTQEDMYLEQLRKDPTRVDLWLKLGTIAKIAGDYPRTIALWTYVAQAGPTSINYIAYSNLGDLYLNFAPDYAKAKNVIEAGLKIKSNDPQLLQLKADLAARM